FIRDFWTGVKSVPLIESRIIFEEITYMQIIIRYELVIKALRSALMLDTPDEQIDEFIRFFGKHIGCDRIYIFEDNKKNM
ncbi:hypothetical protein KTQ83_10450, partial [Holdemanella porci]|nr:hypothetical protein [Holdemanella porci]MBU9872923.1 hypothetical protein [Holdemanella porci]MBU9887928.1 hypothetical protein [Holdemanella porci]